MHRRTYLRTVAAGAVLATGGCLGNSESSDDSGVELRYPTFPPVSNRVTPTQVEEPETEPVEFESLSEEVRFELANVVRRGEYHTGGPPAVRDSDAGNGPIDFHGWTFEIQTGHADGPSPDHGPEGDPDWTDPVDVEPQATNGSLELSLTNELDVPLPIHHYGRPYFGVLTAVGDDSAVLDHDRYAENDAIRTDGVLRTEPPFTNDRDRTELEPGESIRETYAIPTDAPDDGTVLFSLPVGDESIDLLGNRHREVTARFPLRSD